MTGRSAVRQPLRGEALHAVRTPGSRSASTSPSWRIWRIRAGKGGLTPARRQQPLGRGDDPRRIDARQAAEIARLADALIARPAGKPVDLDRLQQQRRIPPGRVTLRRRGSEDRDNRYTRRGRQVQRAAVAADEERTPFQQGAKL